MTAARDWAVPYLTVGGCGILNSPEGFTVLPGRYTDANMSSAKPLQLYKPGVYSCPAGLSGISSYAFSPSNSTAAVYGSCEPEPCFTSDTDVTGTVRGSWGSNLVGSPEFSTLSPGTYTVVAGDEWGNYLLAYFVVS